MSTDPFDAPASSTGITWADHEGELLLVTVHSLETGIVTSLGEKDAIRADIAVLDGPGQGTTFTDTLVFPKVLISQLRPRIGGMVLGRLGKGAAKPGQSAPWLLGDPTEKDKEVGRAYLAANAAPPF